MSFHLCSHIEITTYHSSGNLPHFSVHQWHDVYKKEIELIESSRIDKVTQSHFEINNKCKTMNGIHCINLYNVYALKKTKEFQMITWIISGQMHAEQTTFLCKF